MSKRRVLLVDADREMCEMLVHLLGKEGFDGNSVAGGRAGLASLDKESFEFVLSELTLPDMSGLDFLCRARERRPEATHLVMSSFENTDAAFEAIQRGAYDYISKPFKPGEVVFALRKAEDRERLRRENARLRSEVQQEYEFSNIVSKSVRMLEIFSTVRKISDFKTTCLLMGESGTGKELIARAIHYNSTRRNRSFIAVNCGAIPENLLESELFGHVKGSFTGAVKTKLGLFEEADSGTLFLDEIGELPLLLQVKLLRALQEEEIRRVGDTSSIKVDVRIIAASVKDLGKAVEEGTFREDLFYRLHVLPISIPPLRDRKEDIPLLVQHFLQKHNRKLSMSVTEVDQRAMKILMDHEWPGNVRELENTIERAMVLSKGPSIQPDDLPSSVRSPSSMVTGGRFAIDDLSIKKVGRIMEVELILRALQRSRGNRTKASKLLEISHRSLLYKIKRYRLEGQIRAIQREAELP